jgi:uncharacterized short protein YbdD (DUF466 family)
VPSENEGKRNPLVRQRMYVQGLAPSSSWGCADMLVGFSDGEDCDGGLYLEEEETTHPDQIPLLALRQFATMECFTARCGSSQPTSRP